jgi:hypothetical protein
LRSSTTITPWSPKGQTFYNSAQFANNFRSNAL